jgi:hypothetical protein
MRKLKLAKAEVLENIDSFQPLITWEKEVVRKEACIHRTNQVLSDTPPETSPDNYPYLLVSGKAVPHPIFDPLKIPILPRGAANLLFATEVGFDRKSGFPCRIVKNDDVVKVIVYPENKLPYIMDCFTGLKKEKK